MQGDWFTFLNKLVWEAVKAIARLARYENPQKQKAFCSFFSCNERIGGYGPVAGLLPLKSLRRPKWPMPRTNETLLAVATPKTL